MIEIIEKTAEQEIREKYNYILEAIKTEHAKKITENNKLAEILGTKRTEPNEQNENERYNKELKGFEDKIEQLVLHKDLQEIEYTPQFGTTCKELDTMINKGFINVAKIDITII